MVISFLKSSYEKVKQALSRTQAFFGSKLRALLGGALDKETLEQVEQLLYNADFGTKMTKKLVKVLEAVDSKVIVDPQDRIDLLKKSIHEVFHNISSDLQQVTSSGDPLVIFMVGTNGHGKTTSTAKLASFLVKNGHKVLIAAADTFRAAGADQMEMWAERVGVDVVKGQAKADPSAVIFDSLQAAKARGIDVVLVDTAGRLHTKQPLMQELAKMVRVCQKVIPSAPHEVLLVLDAVTGQNALEQARVFTQAVNVTGIILTKLDGTAKGGIAVAIQSELKIPIKFIGTGEALEDWQCFDSKVFVDALFN